MPNARRQDRELDALYAELPRLDCQGLCHDSCGPIEMSVRERGRIVERARAPVTCHAGASCSMLTPDRRCAVYDIRPTICRLWGLMRGMRCPYGCVPEGGWMDHARGFEFLLRADEIGGRPEGDRQARVLRALRDSLSDEQTARLADELIRPGRATLDGRSPALDRAGVKSPIER